LFLFVVSFVGCRVDHVAFLGTQDNTEVMPVIPEPPKNLADLQGFEIPVETFDGNMVVNHGEVFFCDMEILIMKWLA